MGGQAWGSPWAGAASKNGRGLQHQRRRRQQRTLQCTTATLVGLACSQAVASKQNCWTISSDGVCKGAAGAARGAQGGRV